MDEDILPGGQVGRGTSCNSSLAHALARLVMKTPEQGGDTLVHAALDPALATPAMQGHHLENHRVTRYGDDDNDL